MLDIFIILISQFDVEFLFLGHSAKLCKNTKIRSNSFVIGRTASGMTYSESPCNFQSNGHFEKSFTPKTKKIYFFESEFEFESEST